MNAVKRCLALIAATVLVGACSGDPTADLAGANLTIRATPGEVWLQNDKTQTILLEAVDATGAPAPGNWTATASGVVSVVADTAFEHTTAGHIGQGRQYIVSSSSEGNGTVVFTGTGGTVTVPVRVAPNPKSFNATVSGTNLNIGDTLKITAPAGLRFTSGTTVKFFTTNGRATPLLLSMSPDSTQLSMLPGPSAAGQVTITGIASVETPTLTSTARTTDVITVEKRDSVGETLSANPAAPNTPVTITMPAGTKLRGDSSVVTTDGFSTYNPIVVSMAADSSAITVIPIPGFDTTLTITNLLDNRITPMHLTLPTAKLQTSATLPAPQALPDAGPDDPADPANPSFAVPTAVGTYGGWFDVASMGVPDPTCDGGAAAQFYTVTVANSGNYTFSVEWSSGSDIDFGLFVKNGTYNCGFLSFGGLSANDPETFSANLTAGTTYTLVLIDFGADTDINTKFQVIVKRNS